MVTQKSHRYIHKNNHKYSPQTVKHTVTQRVTPTVTLRVTQKIHTDSHTESNKNIETYSVEDSPMEKHTSKTISKNMWGKVKLNFEKSQGGV